MARLLTLDSCPVHLRNPLLQSLRSCDEAVLLPQAFKSQENQSYKNVIFRLSGETPSLDASIFSPDWFSGVSLIRVAPSDIPGIEKMLACPTTKKNALKELKDAIVSEVSDANVVVGPPLQCDEDERDFENDKWICGFDSTSSFVGIFSADHSKVPENCSIGTNRVHKQYFLVCRAGAGASAATFHSRLLAACAKGDSLDNILENSDSPGPQGVRRLSMSATRNRTRILLQAANLLKLDGVHSIPDHAARSVSERIAVCDIDVSSNVIRKLETTDARSTWQYSTGVDGVASKGLITMSNAGDGLVLFLTSSGEDRLSFKNEAWGCIPLATKRIISGKDMASNITEQYRRTAGHPDKEWIHERFTWKNRQFIEHQVTIEPFSLWGSHEPEKFVHSFSRELGLDTYQTVRLRPELVCCAGVDSGKLRAIVHALQPAEERVGAS